MHKQYITSDGIQQVYRFEKCLFGDDFATAVPGWMLYHNDTNYSLRFIKHPHSFVYLLRVTYSDGVVEEHWTLNPLDIVDYMKVQFGLVVTIE